MIAPLVLLLIVVIYRVVLGIVGSSDLHGLHNFAPVAAIALCGAVYLPRRFALALPLAMLFVSDLILNVFHYHKALFTLDIAPRYLALALIVLLGLSLRGRVRLPGLIAGSVAGSIIFYVITNTGSWLAEPAYPKTLAGWTQALTVGLPGWPSTWWFYRHTMISDLLFTLLFVGCMALCRRPANAFAAADERVSSRGVFPRVPGSREKMIWDGSLRR
jgi:Family of unknown function (DUF6580)